MLSKISFISVKQEQDLKALSAKELQLEARYRSDQEQDKEVTNHSPNLETSVDALEPTKDICLKRTKFEAFDPSENQHETGEKSGFTFEHDQTEAGPIKTTKILLETEVELETKQKRKNSACAWQ